MSVNGRLVSSMRLKCLEARQASICKLILELAIPHKDTYRQSFKSCRNANNEGEGCKHTQRTMRLEKISADADKLFQRVLLTLQGLRKLHQSLLQRQGGRRWGSHC
jgi:transposase-like protein